MEQALPDKFVLEAVKKKTSDVTDNEDAPMPKKPRTSEDFYLFCKFILEHENYDVSKQEGNHECKEEASLGSDTNICRIQSSCKSEITELADIKNERIQESSLEKETKLNILVNHSNINEEDRTNFIVNSLKNKNLDNDPEDDSDEEDSYDLVTCFCKRPFAGRPMIECSKCLTWIHLSCAKVRKSHIPDVYICPSCKENP